MVAAAHRPLSWVSFTVPQDRSDPGFFAPLRSLRTGAAERYFGIVPYHPARQGAGTIQRQAQLIETYLPRDVAPEWGISTECGMGRVGQAADVLALLDAHRDILASLQEVRAELVGAEDLLGPGALRGSTWPVPCSIRWSPPTSRCGSGRRPGLAFGHGGAKVDRLRDELEELTGKPVLLNMLEDRPHPQERRRNAEAGNTAG